MKKQILAAALLAVASFGAYAAEGTTADSIAPKFTYVDASWVRNQVEDTNAADVDFDGFGVRGSFEFAEQFHAFGSYEKTSNNDFLDIDLTETQLGVGWHPEIADGANFLLEASWLNFKAKVNAFGVSAEEDEDMYRVSAGIRAAFNKYLVGNIKANYTEGQDTGSEFTPSMGLEVRFNETWSIVGETELSRDLTHYTVGARASF